jgi:hypothetical protein
MNLRIHLLAQAALLGSSLFPCAATPAKPLDVKPGESLRLAPAQRVRMW